jgi:deazaflavin-dependent oxidoreductase (nitroreductase family)
VTIHLARSHPFSTPGHGNAYPVVAGPTTPYCHERYRAWVRPILRAFARMHLALLRASRRIPGRGLFGGGLVLLTTVGRRSGREWTTPLAFMSHGDSLVVAASCGGSDRLPDWWLNLQHQPTAVIERSGVRSTVHAYEAEHDVLRLVAPEFEERFPQIRFYRRVSRRHIPLVVLEPIPTAEVRRATGYVKKSSGPPRISRA